MFLNTRLISGAYISKSKRCYNAKTSALCFYVKTKMPVNFHICIRERERTYKNIEEREEAKLNYTRNFKISHSVQISKRLNETLERFQKDRIISKIPFIS